MNIPAILAIAASIATLGMGSMPPLGPTYLPSGAAEKVLSVTSPAPTRNQVVVLTQAVAIKETGPKQTVARFGEVYAFAPAFFVVRQEEPTRISFLNLQPDDLHDLLLADENNSVLMRLALPPQSETVHTYTFHKAGLYNFYCTMHQPAMRGQILVLPREARAAR